MAKICSKCGEEKPLDAFGRNGSEGRVRSQCKPCRADSVRKGRNSEPERHILTLMIQRCHNTRHPKYHLYGGRGILVHEAWRQRGGFISFLEHIGRRPSPRHSVDRIDNSRGYEPGNVRWATQSQQMANTRRTRRVVLNGVEVSMKEAKRLTGISDIDFRMRNGRTFEEAISIPVRSTRRLITFDGVTLSCREWSERLGGDPALVAGRLHCGWTEEEAVSTPIGVNRKNRRAAA